MSKIDKIIQKILSGSSDANFSFEELRNILFHLGFTERRSGGSHHIFFKDGVEEIINIQPKGAEAKPYQIKQVRNLIIKYKLYADKL
jgi:predicted RNA binding protein YcfA (HicA-like mRNA interferase family)